MFLKNDNSIIWVSPEQNQKNSSGRQIGTFELPFYSIQSALTRAAPGNKIVLMPGRYTGDMNIEISGSINHPVTITAQEKHQAIIAQACWFLYDCSDLIISGLTFADAPLGALSVIGRCRRNRLEHIAFVNCGTQLKTACTLFFGGSGVRCNVVESCSFTRSAVLDAPPEARRREPSIGCMVSDGQGPGMTMQEGAQPNQDQIFRKNSFVNYDCGIMVGSADSTDFENGTVVEYNTIARCGNGISVKSGDTCVRGNIISCCRESAIAILAGRGSLAADNRIVDCGSGIIARGKAHSIANNCIIRCKTQALHVLSCSPEGVSAAQNLLIENNTCIDWGRNFSHDSGAMPAAIHIDPGTSCIIQRNYFSGRGPAYLNSAAAGKASHSMIADNAVSPACPAQAGCAPEAIEFACKDADNFENNSGFGACGPQCNSAAYDPDQGIALAAPVAFEEPAFKEESAEEGYEEEACEPPPIIDKEEQDAFSEAPLYFPEDDQEMLQNQACDEAGEDA